MEVAAVQQVAVRGPDVPVQRRVLLLQPRESNRRLVDEQLQPRAALAVVQDEEKVGGVRDDEAGPETSACDVNQNKEVTRTSESAENNVFLMSKSSSDSCRFPWQHGVANTVHRGAANS